MNKIKKILISISSQNIPRQYLLLLKDYLTRTMQDVTIDYFISKHDDSNENLRKSAVLESNAINEDMDLFISFDGNLSTEMFKKTKAKKVLLYVAEAGIPADKVAFVKGYDYLITGNAFMDEQFKDACKKTGVILLSDYQNFFEQEFQDLTRRQRARKELEYMYPQLDGKKIVSIITRGKCHSKYMKTSQKIDLRHILDHLPENMVLIINCDELKIKAQNLSSKYTDRYIAITQRNVLDVLRTSDYCVSNHSLSSYIDAKKRVLLYEDSVFEKGAVQFSKEQCIAFEQGMEERVIKLLEEL